MLLEALVLALAGVAAWLLLFQKRWCVAACAILLLCVARPPSPHPLAVTPRAPCCFDWQASRRRGRVARAEGERGADRRCVCAV